MLVGIIAFILQYFLTLITKIQIYPEMFFLPWLVSKGLIPYRDFFDHHGFLLYYVFAPLVKLWSFNGIRFAFFVTQSINLFLVLYILKKTTSKTGYAIGSLLFMLVQFFVSDNIIWYEQTITTCLLVAYALLLNKKRAWIIGIAIGLASFIKPTAAIMIVPAVLIRRNIRVLVSFLLMWLAVLGFYFSHNAIAALVHDLFRFNNFFIRHYHDRYFSDAKFLAMSGAILFFAVAYMLYKRKLTHISMSLAFCVLSVVFFMYLYFRPHLLPSLAFGVIAVSQSVRYMRKKVLYGFLLLIAIYSLGICRRMWIEHPQKNTRFSTSDIVQQQHLAYMLRMLVHDDKRLYVFGNRGELYYVVDRPPPIYYPLLFPLVEQFDTNLESTAIADLEKNHVSVVVMPLPMDENYRNLKRLQLYIVSHYRLLAKSTNYKIFVK